MLSLVVGLLFCSQRASARLLPVSETFSELFNSTCKGAEPLRKRFGESCVATGGNCALRVVDDVFHEDDISRLLAIAEKGMSMRSAAGGLSILDINTGFIRDSNGLENLFKREEGQEVYTSDDFSHYGSIIKRLKSLVSETFGLEHLYFTAPTFITRLDHRNPWEPTEIHDEYWHPHVDRENTDHYFYSGLLYLSTYGVDFEGGRFTMEQGGRTDDEIVVEPKVGRAVIFTSGPEHRHQVERVTSGANQKCSTFYSTI